MGSFGEELDERLRALGQNQSWLAAQVGVTPSSVSNWVRGKHEALTPARVFAIEHLVRVPPGTLSHHLGYVPVGAPAVLASIERDKSLTPMARRALRTLYLSFSQGAES